MCIPVFIHVQTNGDIWVGCDQDANPTSGTSAGIYRVNSAASFQKIGTLSGTVGSYAVSSATGKNGKEITSK